MDEIPADKVTPTPRSSRSSTIIVNYTEAIEQQRRKSAIDIRTTREPGVHTEQNTIKEYWSSAQTHARQFELERINTLRQNTLSKYQSLHDEGYVRNQANYFQKLIMMATPSMNNANKTFARGIKRLEQLAAATAATAAATAAAATADNSEGKQCIASSCSMGDDCVSQPCSPTSPSALECFYCGSTQVYHPNLLSKQATELFRASMLATHDGRPRILLAGICDSTNQPVSSSSSSSFAPSCPSSPHKAPPLILTAVAILSSTDEVYIALTICTVEGEGNNPTAYGVKKIVVFSQDGTTTTPLWEQVLHIVPAVVISSPQFLQYDKIEGNSRRETDHRTVSDGGGGGDESKCAMSLSASPATSPSPSPAQSPSLLKSNEVDTKTDIMGLVNLISHTTTMTERVHITSTSSTPATSTIPEGLFSSTPSNGTPSGCMSGCGVSINNTLYSMVYIPQDTHHTNTTTTGVTTSMMQSLSTMNVPSPRKKRQPQSRGWTTCSEDCDNIPTISNNCSSDNNSSNINDISNSNSSEGLQVCMEFAPLIYVLLKPLPHFALSPPPPPLSVNYP